MGLKEWSIGVFGVITNGNGKVLVQRREDGQGWDIPGGGFQKERDGDLVSALCREVQEETGLSVLGQPVFIGRYSDPARRDTMFVYLLSEVSGLLTTTEESVEHRFVDLETLRKEIRLVWQEYPGHERGRFWEILRDGFRFLLSSEMERGKNKGVPRWLE